PGLRLVRDRSHPLPPPEGARGLGPHPRSLAARLPGPERRALPPAGEATSGPPRGAPPRRPDPPPRAALRPLRRRHDDRPVLMACAPGTGPGATLIWRNC